MEWEVTKQKRPDFDGPSKVLFLWFPPFTLSHIFVWPPYLPI